MADDIVGDTTDSGLISLANATAQKVQFESQYVAIRTRLRQATTPGERRNVLRNKVHCHLEDFGLTIEFFHSHEFNPFFEHLCEYMGRLTKKDYSEKRTPVYA